MIDGLWVLAVGVTCTVGLVAHGAGRDEPIPVLALWLGPVAGSVVALLGSETGAAALLLGGWTVGIWSLGITSMLRREGPWEQAWRGLIPLLAIVALGFSLRAELGPLWPRLPALLAVVFAPVLVLSGRRGPVAEAAVRLAALVAVGTAGVGLFAAALAQVPWQPMRMVFPPIHGAELAGVLVAASWIAVARWSSPWRIFLALCLLGPIAWAVSVLFQNTRAAAVDAWTLEHADELPVVRDSRMRLFDVRGYTCVGTQDGRELDPPTGGPCLATNAWALWVVPRETPWRSLPVGAGGMSGLAVSIRSGWWPRRARIASVLLHQEDGRLAPPVTSEGPDRLRVGDDPSVPLDDTEAVLEQIRTVSNGLSFMIDPDAEWTVEQVVSLCVRARVAEDLRCAVPWPALSRP